MAIREFPLIKLIPPRWQGRLWASERSIQFGSFEPRCGEVWSIHQSERERERIVVRIFRLSCFTTNPIVEMTSYHSFALILINLSVVPKQSKGGTWCALISPTPFTDRYANCDFLPCISNGTPNQDRPLADRLLTICRLRWCKTINY